MSAGSSAPMNAPSPSEGEAQMRRIAQLERDVASKTQRVVALAVELESVTRIALEVERQARRRLDELTASNSRPAAGTDGRLEELRRERSSAIERDAERERTLGGQLEEALNALERDRRQLRAALSGTPGTQSPARPIARSDGLEAELANLRATRGREAEILREISQTCLYHERQAREARTEMERALARSAAEMDALRQRNFQLEYELKTRTRDLESAQAELRRITSGRGWRILQLYCRFRDWLLPLGTRRREIVKLGFSWMTRPLFWLRRFSAKGLARGTYALLTGDLVGLRALYPPMRGEVPAAAPLPPPTSPAGDVRTPLQFPSFAQPLVSIIVPVYNQWPYTYRCLKSILETAGPLAYEAIVADDASRDETSRADEVLKNVRVIHNPKNVGFLRNCNGAAAGARGKYFYFLNNDTELAKGAVDELVRVLESRPDVGIVGSKLIYPDGRLQEAGGIIWKDASGWNFGRKDDPAKPPYSYTREVDYVSGASMMIRASLWQELGAFDERYVPAYYEDADLAFRARERGFKVVYEPKSVVTHYEGVSCGTSETSGIKAYQVRNRDLFRERWKDVLEREHHESGRDVFVARERGRGRKVILFIDHYVPHFDRDAGSRSIFQHMCAVRDMGFSVKFLGENLFRHEPYTSEMERAGIEVIQGNWFVGRGTHEWFEENGRYLDYVHISRPDVGAKYLSLVRQNTPAPIMYFVVDLHYLRETRHYDVDGDPQHLSRAADYKAKELALIRGTDATLTISEDEVQIIRAEVPDKDVVWVPQFCFDTLDESSQDGQLDRRRDLLLVGGFGHTPNVDAAMWFTSSVLPLIRKENPEIGVDIVGSNPPEQVRNLAGPAVRVHGAVSDPELVQLYARARLSVIPLRFGAGVKGKTVETMRFGVPFVGTKFAIEGLPAFNGLAPARDTAADFAQGVLDLYGDRAAWGVARARGLEYVSRHFTKARLQEQMRAAMRACDAARNAAPAGGLRGES